MQDIAAGQNVTLPGTPITISVRTSSRPDQLDIDVSSYLLKGDGKVRNDGDMIFYGQPTSADGLVKLESSAAATRITVTQLPDGVERLAVTVVADDLSGAGRTLRDAAGLELEVEAGGSHFRFVAPVAGERALILGEVYRRGADIKFRAIGQGFNGGLKPLAEHYGVTVDDPAPTASAPAPAPAPAPAIDLRKQRLISLEKKDPELVSLAKKATVSLEKKGVSEQRAKVCLVLDISASMHGLYRSGAIDRLTQRVLGLGLSLDDDGDVDVFLFGRDSHNYGSVDADSYRGFVQTMLRNYQLEGNTMYGLVMEDVRAHYASQPDWGRLPIYVMFVTDGGTQDVRKSETQIMQASGEPIFWQFMAIGEMPRRPAFGSTRRNERVLPRGFDFLQHLDDMQGRVVDNANFFAVSNPDDPTDTELYDLLMEEYPEWLKAVRSKGILRG